MLLDQLKLLKKYKKNYYTHQNFIILKNGAAIKKKYINNLQNLQLFIDNYNSKYLTRINYRKLK